MKAAYIALILYAILLAVLAGMMLNLIPYNLPAFIIVCVAKTGCFIFALVSVSKSPNP